MEAIQNPDDLATMTKSLAETAEALDGVALLLADLAIAPDIPREHQSRLYAVRDAVLICRDRVDVLTDMVDS